MINRRIAGLAGVRMDDDGRRDRRGDRQQDVRTLAATDDSPSSGDTTAYVDVMRPRAPVHDRQFADLVPWA
jgi:hypothetical protein